MQQIPPPHQKEEDPAFRSNPRRFSKGLMNDPSSDFQQNPGRGPSFVNSSLYGRQQEEERLLQAYERCISKDKAVSELVLLTGVSGTGKTALAVQTLQNKTCATACTSQKDCFFVTAKFDQLERSESYYALSQAFQQFVDQVQASTTSPETRERIQTALDRLDQSSSLVTKIIPALKQLRSETPAASNGNVATLTKSKARTNKDESETRETSSTNSINSRSSPVPRNAVNGSISTSNTSTKLGDESRLIVAFRLFLRAICSLQAPIVLFLDDLQWAKASFINLLKEIVLDTAIEGLMILGSCRGNEVQLDHPLAVMLRELEARPNTQITNIVLQDLTFEAVNQMVADLLQLSPEKCQPLSISVWKTTRGNPFFVRQVLHALQEEGLPHSIDETSGRWTWKSLSEIESQLNGITAMELITRKIQRLPKSQRDLLKLASCLGAAFAEDLLQLSVPNNDVKSVPSLLEELSRRGFIRPTAGDDDGNAWKFVHDQYQQAAYSLIPIQDRASWHLSIGRKLWNSLSSHLLYNHMYTVVHQLQAGRSAVTDADEKTALALLYLRAGEKAARSSKFHTAAEYLNQAIDHWLVGRYWRDEYSLSLSLFNAAAEVEYCNGNFDKMSDFLQEALENARSPKDKVRTLTTSIYYMASQRKLQDAIELGFATLRELGETFPANPWNFSLTMEYRKTKNMLVKLKDEDILYLPKIHDENKLVTIRLMILMFAYTIHGRPKLASLIAMRLVQTTLTHGLSSMSCVGFAALTLFLCAEGRDPKLGLRLGHLSIRLVDQFEAKDWIPRVYSYVYAFCFLLGGDPARDCLDPLLTAHRTGLRTGDIEYSNFAAGLYSGLALHASLPLPQVISDTEGFLGIMSLYNQQSTSIQFLKPKLQFAMNLAGRSKTPFVLSGDCMDEDDALKHALEAKNHTACALLYNYKMALSNFFGLYWTAEKCAHELAKYYSSNFPAYSNADSWLHEGLAALVMCGKQYSRKRISIAKQRIKNLQSLSKYSAYNYANKVFLLQAELAVVNGNLEKALQKYNESIRLAEESARDWDVGLASERAATVLKEEGQENECKAFMDKAIEAYTAWGATAKVERLKLQQLEDAGAKILHPTDSGSALFYLKVN